MCTSMTLPLPDRRLCGRTLDLDSHFGERVTLTPRRYPLSFRCAPSLPRHYALLGMAAVVEGYPLYAEAVNESGLYAAGLRFAGEAVYPPLSVAAADPRGRVPLAPWELIPYLLGRCADLNEARAELGRLTLAEIPFSAAVPTAPLHWHVSDADPTHGGMILECTAEGMEVYPDRLGVLTNTPAYPAQLGAWAAMGCLSPRPAEGVLGMGAMGLPGDYTSTSRLIRAAHLRQTALPTLCPAAGEGSGYPVPRDGAPASLPDGGNAPDPGAGVHTFFRILAAVSPTPGAVLTPAGGSHRTLYTCCVDGASGAYHFTTESHPALRTVTFRDGDGEGREPVALA